MEAGRKGSRVRKKGGERGKEGGGERERVVGERRKKKSGEGFELDYRGRILLITGVLWNETFPF